jgi:hypothetical protein
MRALALEGGRAAVRAERVTALATPAARLLLVASVVMAAVSLTANVAAVSDIEAETTLRMAMHASTVATLIFALVAGVYSATTDHRFGLVDQRVLSEPRRRVVLAAKALVSAGVGLLYGVLGGVTAVGVATAYFASQGASFDAGSPVVGRALLGVVIAAPLFAVLGVGVGTLVRNQPVALGGSLAWMLIVEPAVLLGAPGVGKWFPGGAGLALTYSPDEHLLGQGAGGVLLVGITVLCGVVAQQRLVGADL